MDSTDTCVTTVTSKATDEELFAQMAAGGPAGTEAWAEIFLRYNEGLYNLLFRLRLMPQALIPGLVQKTWIRAYKRAETFKGIDVSDADAIRRHTLSWLCQISKSIYYSMWRQQPPVSPLPQPDNEADSQASASGRHVSRGELHHVIKHVEEIVSGSGSDDDISPYKRLLDEALDLLSDMDRDIVLTKFDHYQPGKKHQRLPEAVIEDLCRRYNITPANLRKRRERAIKQIAQHIAEGMAKENPTL